MIGAGQFDPLDSFRLWTLWDMLGNYAWEFFLLSRFLEYTGHQLEMPAPPASSGQNALATTGNPGAGIIGLIGTNPLLPGTPEWLNAEEKITIQSILDLLKSACVRIGISTIEGEINRLKQRVEYAKKSDIGIHLEHLRERVVEEIEADRFLHVPRHRVGYYRVKNLFGLDVGEVFPRAAEDIFNAGTCYALGMNTACVFHLMRVMEHCVQRFGKKLKVSINPNQEPWHQIMLHVHKQIGVLPGGVRATKAQNARKHKYATAASRLDHVRIAWRNEVMHPKTTYDEAEALELLISVKAFVSSIVHLV